MDIAIQNTNLYKKLVSVLNDEIFGSDKIDHSVSPDADLVEDVGLDDLDGVEFAMSVEEEFGIPIDDNDAAKLTTLGKYFNYLKDKGFDLYTCQRKEG